MLSFSVLLSVYKKENPAYLDRALKSLEEQSVAPSEIVLVKDGPLGRELDEVIAKYCRESTLYHIVELPENRGLGIALQKGLEACTFSLVARMDTDDIAQPDRFEKQLAYLKSHPEVDMVGGWIGEFFRDERDYDAIRKVPLEMEEIVRFARYRNPMNHMTVMFRKEAVERAGGYRHFPGFEDYALWVRMIQRGACLANLPDVLVAARTGEAMIRRRRGREYVLREWRFQRWMRSVGFINSSEMCRNLALRIPPRILPGSLVQKVYSTLRQ